MNVPMNEFLKEILEPRESPCLSLYQPTHRHHPDNQQDPIRFRNLVKALEGSLQQKYPDRQIQALLEPFHRLGRDREFWNHTLDGLAVLGAPGFFRVHRLHRQVPELSIVAESFHAKPLIRILQSVDRYQVLLLNRREVKLFEGNRDVIDQIDPAKGVPRTIEEALGSELTEPHLTVASYGDGVKGAAMHHGHGGRKEELDIDAERFFRAVDRAVWEHHSKPSGLPLLLATLPEYHHLYRKVSRNPNLAGGIDIHFEAGADELRKKSWGVLEPFFLQRLNGLVEEFGTGRSRGLGSDDLPEIAAAAGAGRVDTLLIEAGRVIPGRIAAPAGGLKTDDLDHPEVDDLLDDLGERVLKSGGHVVVVPAERMPTRTGAAAIYRF
jgi:hypothetical protein